MIVFSPNADRDRSLRLRVGAGSPDPPNTGAYGGALLSEYAHIIFLPGMTADSAQEFTGGSLSAVFLVGAAGIVLGVIALLGIHPVELTAIAK